MILINDVLKGDRTGDLYLVVNKHKHHGQVSLKKIWVNPTCKSRRSMKLGSIRRGPYRDAQRMTLIGRNYQEKAK